MIGGAGTGPHQEIKLSRLFRHSTAQIRPHGASTRLDKRAYPAKGRGGIDQLGCESCAVGRNRFVGMNGNPTLSPEFGERVPPLEMCITR